MIQIPESKVSFCHIHSGLAKGRILTCLFLLQVMKTTARMIASRRAEEATPAIITRVKSCSSVWTGSVTQVKVGSTA